MEQAAQVEVITPLLSPDNAPDVTGASMGQLALRRRTPSGDRGISPTNSYRGTLPRGSFFYPYSHQLVQSPVHMQHSQSAPQHQQLLAPQSDTPTSDVTLRARSSQPPVRIKMKQGLPKKRLSDLKVENMCRLLEQLEGMSHNRIEAYQERLQENNITGQVRVHYSEEYSCTFALVLM